jgi:hypothetical protein
MNQIVEICFRYQQNFYSCIVSVMADPVGNYFLIELLDADLVALFETQYLKYAGENGYRTLPSYKDDSLRPLLIHITNLVVSTGNMLHKQS